jgi:hypothetical protein
MPIQTIELDIVTEDHDYSVDAAMASLLEAAQVSPTCGSSGRTSTTGRSSTSPASATSS